MTRIRLYDTSIQQTRQIYEQEQYLAIAVSNYFEELKFRGRPQNTIHSYHEKLLPFIKWCDSQAISKIEQITPDIIRDYFNLLSVNHNPGGVHGYYRVIRAFFNWWFAEYEPEDIKNPFLKAKMKPPHDPPLDPVPNETVKKLLETCKTNRFYDIRDQAIIAVLYDSGIRANELIMLDRSDLDDRTLNIRFGKGKQIRLVHFGLSTKKNLTRYINKRFDLEIALFISDFGERLTYDGLRKIIVKRSVLAGVDTPSLHSFRRAFALNCLLANWDIYRLKDEMGHNSLDVLERYLKIVEAMRADLSRMTSPLDNLRITQEKKKLYRSY
ncbi:MAG: hypothetical protein A2X24_12025 [Chloroflexi bacterium GWB2_54_36]|nr:MAG: hypothetical protein A2X24_12025 [Chloroflexi bacterium GWB2_54_36]